MPRESSECFCLLVLLLDSLYKKENKYYLQVFLEECKYVYKEKKNSIKNFITDEVEISSDDSGEKNSDEKNSDEKILRKKIKYWIFWENKSFFRVSISEV